MLEMPDDPIAHSQPKACEDRIEDGVKGNDGSVVNVVSHLPADATMWGETPDTLPNDFSLLCQVTVELQSFLVFLADVVGRRGNDKSKCPVRAVP